MVHAAHAVWWRADLAAAQQGHLKTLPDPAAPEDRRGAGSGACWPLVLAAAASLPGVFVIAWITGLRLMPHWPVSWATAAAWVVVAPVVEELIFRGGVQEWLLQRLSLRWPGLSPANLIAALLFAVAHLLSHPPLWALATGLAGLVFGWAYERRRRLAAPILLHGVYNATFLFLLSAAPA